jgi:hypothetical protein
MATRPDNEQGVLQIFTDSYPMGGGKIAQIKK